MTAKQQIPVVEIPEEPLSVFDTFEEAFLHWLEVGGKLFEANPQLVGGECWIVAVSEHAANRLLLKGKGISLVTRVGRAEAQLKVVQLARQRRKSVADGETRQ